MNIIRQKNDPPAYPYGRALGLVSAGGNLYKEYSISIPLMSIWALRGVKVNLPEFLVLFFKVHECVYFKYSHYKVAK